MRDKPSTKAKGKRISLDDEDAIDVGLFPSGPARITESIFADYDYGGNTKPQAVWLIAYERDGEPYEQPYSLGKGWRISEDGTRITNKAGHAGLAKSCNAIRHLVTPLKIALKEAGIDSSILGEGDPTVLVGMDTVLRRVDQEDRPGLKPRKRRDGEESGPRSILEIEEVLSAPWDKSSGKAGSKKKKAAKKDEDDDADEAEDEDEADDSDEDDDEAEDKRPASRKPKPAARAKANGKGRSDDDEDEDDAEDEGQDDAVAEDAIEALIEAVDGGPVKYAKLEATLRKSVKGKKADAIVEWALNKKNLKTEKGWSFDGTTVEAGD